MRRKRCNDSDSGRIAAKGKLMAGGLYQFIGTTTVHIGLFYPIYSTPNGAPGTEPSPVTWPNAVMVLISSLRSGAPLLLASGTIGDNPGPANSWLEPSQMGFFDIRATVSSNLLLVRSVAR